MGKHHLALRGRVRNQPVDLTRSAFKLLGTLIESTGRVPIRVPPRSPQFHFRFQDETLNAHGHQRP